MTLRRFTLAVSWLGLLLIASGGALAEPLVARGAIPFKQEKQGGDTQIYQSLAAVALAGLAAYGIIVGLKRHGGKAGAAPGRTRRLRMVEAVRLGRRGMLYVVEYQGQELLLAESEHGIQLLNSRPAAAAAATDATGVADA